MFIRVIGAKPDNPGAAEQYCDDDRHEDLERTVHWREYGRCAADGQLPACADKGIVQDDTP